MHVLCYVRNNVTVNAVVKPRLCTLRQWQCCLNAMNGINAVKILSIYRESDSWE